MRAPTRFSIALAVALVAVLGAGGPASAAEEPMVRAVLYFSPTCGHCHIVIQDVLPGVFAENGGEAELSFDETLAPEMLTFYLMSNGQIDLLLVDVATEPGAEFYTTTLSGLGMEPKGVPMLVVGEDVMIGSADIPAQFPGIIASAVADGTPIEWPAIPNIAEAVIAAGGPVDPVTTTTPAPSTTASTPATTTAPDEAAQPTTPTTEAPEAVLPALVTDRSMLDRFREDVTANSISLVVLVAMVVALGAAAIRLSRGAGGGTPSPAIPVLAVAGLGIAIYLAFVEVGGSDAVCGPVGDCNTVQQSDYAELAGIVPVGVIGVIGYTLTIVTWSIARFAPHRAAGPAALAMFVGAAAGTGLSIYLTFLEPFVIGATCMWCITSAVIITAIMWLSVGPARAALPPEGRRWASRLRPAGR